MNATQRPVNYPRKLMLMNLCQELGLDKLQGKISLLSPSHYYKLSLAIPLSDTV